MADSKEWCVLAWTKNIGRVVIATVVIWLSFSATIIPYQLAHAKCHFPAIFNFGDSNSDTGGLSAAFGQIVAPSGETYFGSPSGRASDGRLIIDFIAESVGLPHLSAFLDAVGSNFSYGANFATGGSTIIPVNATYHQSSFSPFSLNFQLYQYNDFHRRSQIFYDKGGIYRGLLPNAEEFSRALYTFDIGQNDLSAGYFVYNKSTYEVKAYVPDILAQFSTAVKSVYDKGGRYFWIHNTGPVGCLPFILERLPVPKSKLDKAGCSTPYNSVAQYYNLKLKETVLKLRKEIPLAAITYVDVYSLKYALSSEPKLHGFKEPLRACCGHGGKYNFNKRVGCGGKIKKNGKEILVGKSCEDPSVVVNWDGIHYTEAASKFIFEHIVNGSYSDPPIPLSMACYRH